MTDSQVGRCSGLDPKSPYHLMKVQPLPALLLPLLKPHRFPSGTALIPLLPLLPPPGKKKREKESTNSPGRGCRQQGERTGRREEDRRGKRLTSPWEDRAWAYREERGYGQWLLVSSATLPTVQGTSTQPRGQVCVGSGLIEERSRRNKSLKPSEFP